jgi:hypothetical protein
LYRRRLVDAGQRLEGRNLIVDHLGIVDPSRQVRTRVDRA